MKPDYNPKLSRVNVENLRLRAYIGFIEWETEKLQDVVISFSFNYDVSLAAATDEVQYAVDYKKITKHIIEMVDHQSFHLIEALAENIYEYIVSESEKIQEVEVKVEKPYALRFADNVFIKVSGADRYHPTAISLGANINPEENFQKALLHLQNLGIIVQRSQFVYTKALKYEDQPDFLNGVVLLHTKKSLSELKMKLKEIEALLGRARSENKNAPREMDLDVVTYDNFLIDKDLYEFPFMVEFVKQLQPELKI